MKQEKKQGNEDKEKPETVEKMAEQFKIEELEERLNFGNWDGGGGSGGGGGAWR